jgi:hypothetical protein
MEVKIKKQRLDSTHVLSDMAAVKLTVMLKLTAWSILQAVALRLRGQQLRRIAPAIPRVKPEHLRNSAENR